MSLLNDILTWTNADLKPWQSDAVRRLFSCKSLMVSDYEELYAMLKAEYGIPDPNSPGTIPFSRNQLPAAGIDASSVILEAVRDLKNVNLIGENQRIDFTPKGMTIVYGENASGKSGYSRVLKRACRSRDEGTEVFPNAMLPEGSIVIPEAVFDILKDGKREPLLWREGQSSPDELSVISVFDKHCARAILDEEQEVAFMPYGLDVVENLAQQVFPEINNLLEAELERTRVDFSVFNDLIGSTKVGKLISELSRGGDEKRIMALGNVSDLEKRRLLELEKILKESDPKSKAKALTLAVKRIEALSERLGKAIEVVSKDVLASVRQLDEETEAALKAQKIAAENFRAGEALLPGTGEQAWRKLFEAARRFSIEKAYPGMPFPVVREGAK